MALYLESTSNVDAVCCLLTKQRWGKKIQKMPKIILFMTLNASLKFCTFNCKSIKRSIDQVRQLCTEHVIIALQETWLFPHDLSFLDTIHPDFASHGVSAIDTTQGIICGRPYGCVALLWNKRIFTSAEVISCDNKRTVAVKLGHGDRSILILSVYMPTNCQDNLPEFTQCLGNISAVIESVDVESVFAFGDFNAHPDTLFGKELLDYCEEQSLRCVDIDRLSANTDTDTYTYVSDAHGTCRWLDHCAVTEAAASTVTGVYVRYDAYSSDHIPLVICCDIYVVSKKLVKTTLNSSLLGIIWGNRDNEVIKQYTELCNNKLISIKCNLDCDNNACSRKCFNIEHRKYIDRFYLDVVSSIQKCAIDSGSVKRLKKRKIIGWNAHIKPIHTLYRQKFLQWASVGRPRTGPYYGEMSAARREFKSALRYVQHNQEKIKMEILARHNSEKNFQQFWKEVKKLNLTKCLPISVEGKENHKDIANLFINLFNVTTVRNNNYNHDNDNRERRDSEVFQVTKEDIVDTLKSMKRGRSPGHDGLGIEHMIYAGQYIYELLARLFTLCVRHCYLPLDMIRTVVVPIPKNKTGDVSSGSNYRPISLATVVAKIFERFLSRKLTRYIPIDDGQFGFRTDVSTDMAIFALKRVVSYYTERNTTVYACFLDLSRAFDAIDRDLLWRKLRRTKVSAAVVDLFAYWYGNQVNNVRWGDEMSDDYKTSYGVRQGGLTSPDLFNLYVNDLIEELSGAPVGLRLGGRFVNNLSYADDMVLLSPSIKGLRKLLSICERYANEHSLTYNAKKTEMMIFRSGKGPENVPAVFIAGQQVKIVEQFKYLGHILTSNRKDDLDIERQRRSLSVVGNMLTRKFKKCDKTVKIALFRSYCQSFYTCQLWAEYTGRSWNGIRVQYNNIFRCLMGLSRGCSASGMFLEARVNTFNAIQRHRVASFMSRVLKCSNNIIKELAEGIISANTFKQWLQIAA